MPQVISIGGVALGVSFKGPSVPLGWEEYAPFRVEKPADAGVLSVTGGRRPARRGGASELKAAGGVKTASYSRDDFSLRMSPKACTLSVAENPYSFDSALRVLYSRLLADREGLLIHAAGLIQRGRGFLFAGKSGSGKSTLTRWVGREKALSDELTALRFDGKAPSIYSTPFWGELSRGKDSRQAPLAAVCFLGQGANNLVTRLSTADAFRSLLGTVLWFDPSPRATARVIECAARVAGSVPCLSFAWKKDSDPWPALERAL